MYYIILSFNYIIMDENEVEDDYQRGLQHGACFIVGLEIIAMIGYMFS